MSTKLDTEFSGIVLSHYYVTITYNEYLDESEQLYVEVEEDVNDDDLMDYEILSINNENAGNLDKAYLDRIYDLLYTDKCTHHKSKIIDSNEEGE